MSFARQYRPALSLVAVALVALGSLTRVDVWLPPLLRAEICDGLHVPAGMLLCFVVTLWRPLGGKSLVESIAMVAIAAGILEVLQWQVGRSASWRDALLTAGGAALAAGILYRRQSGKPGLKRPLASLGVALFVVATLPIMNKLAAIDEVRALWPQLGNFESSQQDALWQPYQDTTLTHAEHGELQTAMGMLDQSYLKVEGTGSPPVIRHWVVSPDWSAMKTFCLEARYPLAATLKVVFHAGAPVASVPPPGDPSELELPAVDYELTQFWKRHCTPLAQLGTGSQVLDLKNVRALTLSVTHGTSAQSSPEQPMRLDLDNVRLYP